MDLKKLTDEISKSGFMLEWKTAAVFKQYGFEVEQNILLPNTIRIGEFQNQLVEVDVLATALRAFNPGDRYIVECKGSSPDDRLVVVRTAQRQHHFPSVYFDNRTVVLNWNDNILCDDRGSVQPICCHTGDFFSCKENGSVGKISKQDEKNNLYKGIGQLHLAIEAIFSSYSQNAAFKVIPTIVTNAEITVATFDPAKNLSDQIILRQVPWVAFQNPLIYPRGYAEISTVEWKSVGGVDTKAHAREPRVPLIWIVNIEKLPAFLEATAKSYPTNLLPENLMTESDHNHPN